MGVWAEIGRSFFPTPSCSGTPEGLTILNGMKNAATALAHGGAGAAALYYGGALAGGAKAAAGLAANRLARQAVNSRFVTNSLIDNALGNTNSATVRGAQRAATYAGLPVIRKDHDREPLKLTVNPK